MQCSLGAMQILPMTPVSFFSALLYFAFSGLLEELTIQLSSQNTHSTKKKNNLTDDDDDVWK